MEADVGVRTLGTSEKQAPTFCNSSLFTRKND